MSLKTLPESAPRIDGEALATAWLAAGAAGSRAKGDRRLDRALTIESYNKGKTLGGYCFIGTSADVAVIACVPVYQGPVGPAGLWTLIQKGKPVDRWPINDQKRGAPMLRQLLTDARAADKSGGKVWSCLTAETHVPEGTIGDTGARSYVSIAIDGATEGLLVEQASFTPIDWRDTLAADDAFIAPTSVFYESASLYGRLSRILGLLPVTEVTWTHRGAANGAAVMEGVYQDDTMFVSIVHGLPSIWKVAPLDPLSAYEQGALDDDDDDLSPSDREAKRMLAAAGFDDEVPVHPRP